MNVCKMVGVAYTLIPAIKKLYQTKKEDRAAVLNVTWNSYAQPFMYLVFWGYTYGRKNIASSPLKGSMMLLSQG